MRRLRASGPGETRLEWLKRLRNTKPSSGLTEVMHAKGWIEGKDDPRSPEFQVKPEWVGTAADHPIVKPPKPKRVWGKRVRTEYFREYMRGYRARKKAKEK